MQSLQSQSGAQQAPQGGMPSGQPQNPQQQGPQSMEDAERMMRESIPPELRDMIAPDKNEAPKRRQGIFGGGASGIAGVGKELTAAQQTAIENSNSKYNEDLDRRAKAAKNLVNIANAMEELISGGNVSSGLFGAIQGKLGASVQGGDTSDFDSLSEDAANEAASLLPGVITNEKLKSARRTKPNLSQTKSTQLSRIYAMKKKAEDVLLLDRIRREIVKENGGVQPRNIGRVIEDRVAGLGEDLSKSQKTSAFKIGSVVSESNSKGIPEGATSIGEDGNPYVRKNGKWVPA
jgi:hypothetical protein